ncbi:TPA: hypothetical protein ACH3X1_007313 [Trebouxia sp. C0004]
MPVPVAGQERLATMRQWQYHLEGAKGGADSGTLAGELLAAPDSLSQIKSPPTAKNIELL